VDQAEDSFDRWSQVVAAAQRALQERPPDAATLVVDSEQQTIWIQPRDEQAAAVEIGYRGTDEIYLGVGLTESRIWEDASRPLEEELYQILAGVMAGRFEEVGSFDARGRVRAPRGEIRFGSTPLLPWSWRWRHRRAYAPYS
jgi:hypothetical protein